MRSFWTAISYILHPLLLISYAFIVLFNFLPYFKVSYLESEPIFLMLYIFTNTFVLPVAIVFIMKKSGAVKSLLLSDRRERIIPYIITTIICVITTWQIFNVQIDSLSFRFMLGVTLVLAFVTIINFRFKISSHSASIAGLCALFTYLFIFRNEISMLPWMTISFVLAFLSMSSRIYLKAHSIKEIYWGFILGFCTIFISVAL